MIDVIVVIFMGLWYCIYIICLLGWVWLGCNFWDWCLNRVCFKRYSLIESDCFDIIVLVGFCVFWCIFV